MEKNHENDNGLWWWVGVKMGGKMGVGIDDIF